LEEDISNINILAEIEENNKNILLEEEDMLNVDMLAEIKEDNEEKDIEI
jgi:hypothetical protein